MINRIFQVTGSTIWQAFFGYFNSRKTNTHTHTHLKQFTSIDHICLNIDSFTKKKQQQQHPIYHF